MFHNMFTGIIHSSPWSAKSGMLVMSKILSMRRDAALEADGVGEISSVDWNHAATTAYRPVRSSRCD